MIIELFHPKNCRPRQNGAQVRSPKHVRRYERLMKYFHVIQAIFRTDGGEPALMTEVGSTLSVADAPIHFGPPNLALAAGFWRISVRCACLVDSGRIEPRACRVFAESVDAWLRRVLCVRLPAAAILHL